MRNFRDLVLARIPSTQGRSSATRSQPAAPDDRVSDAELREERDRDARNSSRMAARALERATASAETSREKARRRSQAIGKMAGGIVAEMEAKAAAELAAQILEAHAIAIGEKPGPALEEPTGAAAEIVEAHRWLRNETAAPAPTGMGARIIESHEIARRLR